MGMPSNLPSNTKPISSESPCTDVRVGPPKQKAPALTTADLAARGITPQFLQRLQGSKDLAQR